MGNVLLVQKNAHLLKTQIFKSQLLLSMVYGMFEFISRQWAKLSQNQNQYTNQQIQYQMIQFGMNGKLFQKIETYSQIQKQWQKYEMINIDFDKQGQWLQVNYGSNSNREHELLYIQYNYK